jgi:hypothetical protein
MGAGASVGAGLGAALRGAAIPSAAGLAFELGGLAWVLGAATALVGLGLLAGDTQLVATALGSGLPMPGPKGAMALLAMALPVVLTCARVGAGAARLARAARSGRDEPVTLARAWTEGRRFQAPAAGVWFQIFGMMASGTFVLIGPLVALTAYVGQEALGPFGVVLSGLALVLTLVYAAELAALHQLAVASLVRNDRGVGSAVLHGWRLMRAAPRRSRRFAALEFAVRALILLAAGLAAHLSGPGWGLLQLFLLGAVVGSARCRAWAIAYPDLGGLPDKPPGLGA